MKILGLLLLTLGLAPLVNAQECLGFKLKPGTGYEMTLYDGKDKVTGTMTYTVKNVRKEGASTVVDVETLMTSSKGKSMPANVVHYTCTGNEVVVDMSGLGGQNPGMKDTEVRLINNDITYPRMLSTGSKLKDGTVKTEAYNNGTKMMEMTLGLTNRQVEGKESLTTPAGSFETYKVSADLNVESKMMGIPIRRVMRTVSYRTNDVLFDIKNESYDKGGKRIGSMVLTKTF